jgi:hypothetical protein
VGVEGRGGAIIGDTSACDGGSVPAELEWGKEGVRGRIS